MNTPVSVPTSARVIRAAGIVFAVLIASYVTTCVYRTTSFAKLQELPIAAQIEQRACPKPTNDIALLNGSVEATPIGPYVLRHENNYLQIDARHYYKAGQPSILPDGSRSAFRVDQATINVHTLAPDMVPHFLMTSAQSQARYHGNLYWVGIDIFWSPDGSAKPPNYESASRDSEPLPNSVRHYPQVGLREEELPSKSGWTKRYRPDEADPLGMRSSAPIKIVCTGLHISNQGTCHVDRQLRNDVWIQYAFNSENLACWRDIDRRVLSLLDRFSNSWAFTSKQGASGS